MAGLLLTFDGLAFIMSRIALLDIFQATFAVAGVAALVADRDWFRHKLADHLRARGMQCYGIGPGLDAEDGPKGYGAHSDQERIIESELYRFVRFQHDIVESLARAR